VEQNTRHGPAQVTVAAADRDHPPAQRIHLFDSQPVVQEALIGAQLDRSEAVHQFLGREPGGWRRLTG